MFDFIFKRSARKSSPTPAPEQKPDSPPPQILARQTALAQATALNGAESAAVAFILQCEFADARLKAAEHVQSRDMLEQVQQAMRNADRRVAKLMQARLDALQQQELSQQQAQRCVDDALRLAQEPQVMPNQVADLDRAWQAVSAAPASLRSSFDETRAALRARLEAQAALQRAVIDVLARLRKVGESAEPEETAQMLDALEQEIARHRASPEAAALPKHLLPEFTQQFTQQHQTLKQTLAERHAAIVARRQALDGWEAEQPAALAAETIRQAWQAFPGLPESEATLALQARFDALLLRVQDRRKPKRALAQELKLDVRQHFADVLDGMEKALQDGALQLASEHDKTLRAFDLKAAGLSEVQTAQLASARSELSRLQGWAKWGGNISREELLKAAESLPAQAPAVLELAKKVGSLRERWKSLDVSAGPAARELWERFDAACSTAYAPAAAHFKKLAEERQQNMAKAQAMIVEIGQFTATSNCLAEDAAVDWKAVANYCLQMKQAWQRLGTIDRKEKKRLETAFDLAMQAMSAPLARQQEREVRRREKLIAEAAGLNPGERGTLDALRALQERWQEQAKSLPLARKEEQELWQRFRAACDAVFAKRKEEAVAADADRQQQLQAKEALCAALEQALHGSDAAVAKLLRENRDAWSKIGSVPRASEAQIEMRFKTAVEALQQQLDAAKRAAAAAEVNALRDKLALCQKIETALGNEIAADTAAEPGNRAAWNAEWQALPVLSKEFERVLRQRFEAALILESEACQYAALLEQNRAVLSHEVLRLEIMLGIESPAELSRVRLKLQVEVLQSSLKAGQKLVTQDAQLLRLCGLAALANSQTATRIDRLITGIRSAA